jgi:hypothetical protein
VILTGASAHGFYLGIVSDIIESRENKRTLITMNGSELVRILRVIYVLAIAIALVFLVVAGVQAFYPEPSCPEYWGWGYPLPPPDYDSPEYEEWQQQCNEAQEEYQQALEAYEREAAAHDKNTFLVLLSLGAVFAIGGTFLQRRTAIFGAGLILGGIGTMILAIVPYDLDNVLRFAGIAAILAVLIFVGYKVFLSLRRS